MTSVLSWLHELELWQVIALLFLMNVGLRQTALVGSERVARRYRHRRIIGRPTELRLEDRLGVVTLVLNAAVSVVGCCGAVATSSSPRPSVPPSCVMRCC